MVVIVFTKFSGNTLASNDAAAKFRMGITNSPIKNVNLYSRTIVSVLVGIVERKFGLVDSIEAPILRVSLNSVLADPKILQNIRSKDKHEQDRNG
jgi:hypothetical protein